MNKLLAYGNKIMPASIRSTTFLFAFFWAKNISIKLFRNSFYKSPCFYDYETWFLKIQANNGHEGVREEMQGKIYESKSD
jgi:hypothetical protein